LKERIKIAKINHILSDDRLGFAVVLAFSLAIGAISWFSLPNGGMDMRDDILPSLHNWLAPWKEGTPLFPWATLVLMPLRLFNARGATAIINGVSILLLALVIKRFKGNVLFTIPIVISPFGAALLENGQTDALILASLLLPAGLDLLLFWKPQVCAHAFWVRFRVHPKTYIVSAVLLVLVSFFIWGFWPREVFQFAQENLIKGWWNRALWPYAIPFGLGLVYLSIRNNDEGYGVMASPLLFPYVNIQSYIGLLVVVACKWPKIFGICYLIYLGFILVPGLHLPFA
jgi:hypothetical protein